MTERQRETVAAFDNAANIQAAVEALQLGGFDRADLSLLATDRVLTAAFADAGEARRALDNGPGVPLGAHGEEESRAEAQAGVAGTFAYVGAVASAASVVAAGGAVAAAVVAAVAAAGAGGAIGIYLSRFIGECQADLLEDRLRNGGLLLWVRTPDARSEQKARGILEKHNGADIQTHELPAPDLPEDGGVSGELSFVRHLSL